MIPKRRIRRKQSGCHVRWKRGRWICNCGWKGDTNYQAYQHMQRVGQL